MNQLEDRLAGAAPALDAMIEAHLASAGRRPERHRLSRRTLLRGTAAAAVVGAGVAAVAVVRGTTTPTAVGTVPRESTPAIPTPSHPTSPNEVAARTALGEPLGPGMEGDAVTALQERLTALGFAPGPVTGEYDERTEQAVWAFAKLVVGVPLPELSSIVTDELWQSMQNAVDILPLRAFARSEATRNHTEIYLPQQVAVFFVDDQPALITHISSGSGAEWSELVAVDPGEQYNEYGTAPIEVRITAVSRTPGGAFKYDRIVAGDRSSVLEAAHNPAYFNFGIGIAGSASVPKEPASHGMVRVPRHVSDMYFDVIALDDDVFVWNGEHEPEDAPNDYPWNELDTDVATAEVETTS